jgi:DNA-binding transcriptional MerR regulator
MSKLSGVTAHTLRAWEKRYGALKPSRTQGGQRAYNVQDLERLRRLKNLTETGFSIGQIAHLPDER